MGKARTLLKTHSGEKSNECNQNLSLGLTRKSNFANGKFKGKRKQDEGIWFTFSTRFNSIFFTKPKYYLQLGFIMCNEKSKSWKWFDFELQGSRRPKANEELLAIEMAWFWHFLCFPHKEGAGAGSSNSVWFLTFLMFFTRARKVQVQVALTQLIAWLERHGLHFLPTSERYKQCRRQSWKSCDKKQSSPKNSQIFRMDLTFVLLTLW